MKDFKIEIQIEYTTRKNLLNYFGYVRKMSYLCAQITSNNLLRQVKTNSIVWLYSKLACEGRLAFFYTTSKMMGRWSLRFNHL